MEPPIEGQRLFFRSDSPCPFSSDSNFASSEFSTELRKTVSRWFGVLDCLQACKAICPCWQKCLCLSLQLTGPSEGESEGLAYLLTDSRLKCARGIAHRGDLWTPRSLLGTFYGAFRRPEKRMAASVVHTKFFWVLPMLPWSNMEIDSGQFFQQIQGSFIAFQRI